MIECECCREMVEEELEERQVWNGKIIKCCSECASVIDEELEDEKRSSELPEDLHEEFVINNYW